jgi:hypothetical protein
MDKIIINKHGNASSFDGRDAVEVMRLACLVSGLKLEMKCPGMKVSRHISALKAAKQITGLKTNDRAKHLARAELMLEAAKRNVAYVTEGGE